MSGPHFLQKFGQLQPGRIDIDDKQFRTDLRGELFRFMKRPSYRSRVLRREFLQSRANGSSQGIVLFEKKNITLRHIRTGRFTTSRHLGNTFRFLEYDKAKRLVKGKQAQFACPWADACVRLSIYSYRSASIGSRLAARYAG